MEEPNETPTDAATAGENGAAVVQAVERSVAAMTPEQRAEARRLLDAADEAAPGPNDQGSAPDADPQSRPTRVYTNLLPSQHSIPDLGFGKGSSFVPFSFKPHEQRDLARIFSEKQLRASNYLAESERRGEIFCGKAPPSMLKRLGDPLTAAVERSGEGGVVADPAFGERWADKAYDRVEDKEDAEDEMTQKKRKRRDVLAQSTERAQRRGLSETERLEAERRGW